MENCPKCGKEAELLFPKSIPKSRRYYCTPCKFHFISESTCSICNTSEFGGFGKTQGIESEYVLCEVHYKEYWRSYKKFRDIYRLDNHVSPYKDKEMEEGKTYPAGCYLCGTLKNHSDFKLGCQHYKCPDCQMMVKKWCDDWIRDNKIHVLIEQPPDNPQTLLEEFYSV